MSKVGNFGDEFAYMWSLSLLLRIGNKLRDGIGFEIFPF